MTRESDETRRLVGDQGVDDRRQNSLGDEGDLDEEIDDFIRGMSR
jgi:hypothetical protein